MSESSSKRTDKKTEKGSEPGKQNRREFLKLSALSGAALGAGAWLSGCQPANRGASSGNGDGPTVDRSLQMDPEWQRIKYGEWGGPGVSSQPGPMDDILLKDYAPTHSLKLEKTEVDQAAFPVIDCHIHDYASRVDEPFEEVLDQWVEDMDAAGVEMSVLLTVATGEEFDRLMDAYVGRYPDRFQLWCGIDTGNVNDPGYSERAAREIERCYNAGARGVGEVTDKGAGITGGPEVPMSERMHLDDDRLDAAWETCARLDMPVNVHIADHPSAWQPLGIHQERTPDYQHFNNYGLDILSPGELFEQRDNMLEKHPETTFIACHLSNQMHDPTALSAALDRYPNFYLDVSARDYEVGRIPRTAARLFQNHQDRILFGTDTNMKLSMYRAWWRLLESDDEFITGRVWWPYYGLDLPRETLRAMYRENARRIMNWEPTT
ncbi:MAG: amidohydrolase family protein [Balneolaceae bacterium]